MTAHRLRRIAALLWVGLLWTAACLPAAEASAGAKVPASAQTPPLHVLVLNSYEPEYLWTRSIMRGIRTGLREAGIDRLRLSVEFMDCRRFPYETVKPQIRQMLQAKYGGSNLPAVILACDNEAHRFLREEGQALFPGIPVVVSGVNGLTEQELCYASNIHAIQHRDTAFQDTLRLARSMVPQARRLLIIVDQTPTGLAMAAEQREVLRHFRHGFESIAYLPESSIEELEEYLIALPHDTVVLFGLFNQDRLGRTWSIPEITSRISGISPVPVFGTLDLSLRSGIVGGRLVRGETLGELQARTAVAILQDKPPAQMTVITGAQMPLSVDYAEVMRYGLNPALIPAGAEVLNRPRGLFDLYRENRLVVIGGALIMLLEALTIVLLLFNRHQLVRVRNALSESEELYSALVNDPPVCICRHLADGTILFGNATFRRYFARTSPDPVGENLADLLTPANPAELYAYFRSHTPDSPVHRYEREVDCADGQRRYMRWLSRGVFDPQGRLDMIQSLGEDVTDLRNAYNVLIENERRFRTVADFTCGWESWLSPEGEVLYISPFCENITGYPAKEFRLHPQMFAELIYSEDRRAFERFWSQNEEATSLICRLVHRDGRVLWVEQFSQPVRGQDGAALGRRISCRDVTERKRAEEALRDNEEHLRITLQAISDAVLTTDLEGGVRSINQAGERLLCRHFSDLAGLPLAQVLDLREAYCEDPVREVAARIFSGEGWGDQPHTCRLRDGSGAWTLVELTGAPIRNAAGIVAGAVLVIRDVSRQVELERQLRQTQKMEAIGRLAGGVAHDFNNMLGGIMGAAELMVSNCPDDPEAQRYAELILRTAERASRLTGQLLAFARKGCETARPVDMHEIINDALEILSSSIDKRIRIQTELAAMLHVVQGDPTQLENVIINLGLNARDAMVDGGELRLRTRNHQAVTTEALAPGSLLAPGHYLVLEVCDSGEGIAPENLGKIFDPFFTTKEVGKGTGLGLAAVYGILQDHGGGIGVRSKPGEGATFSIYIPLETKPVQLEQCEVIGDYPEGEGTVLLVDDEDQIRGTVGQMLRECGYAVIEAATGREAVERYQTFAGRIDLVILDMVMPDLSGAEVFRAIHEIHPQVRVLLSSGYVRDTNISELLAAGAKGFLKKPYRMRELLAEVARVMDDHPEDGGPTDWTEQKETGSGAD